MKKILLLILIILLMLSMSMALVCCDNSTQEESDDPVVEVEPDDDIVVEDIVPDSPDPDEDTPEDVVPDTSDAIYSVTFDGNGGSEVSEQTLAPGSTATYIEPTREGFTFAGWYSDGSEYAFDSVVYSDTQLTAMWYGTEQDSSGIQYTLDSDCQAYTVVGIDSTASGDIELPSTFMNLPVESIAESAFANNSSIVSIVIPSSVTYIGYGAFSGCSSLVSMTVPYIGESWASSTNCHFGYIFGDDSYLTSSSDSTNVPASLTELTVSNGAVSAYSVQYMTNITTLVLAEGVTTIGHDAFGGCSSLTSVVIEDTVTTIGYRAFYDCGSLTSLVVGSSVSSVGYSAFWGCVQLVQLCNLSDLSLTAGSDDYGYIAYYAIDMFDDVEDIDNTKLSVDDNGYVLYTANDQVVLVAYIGSSSEVVVPSSVTVLSRHAFQYNSVVTSVDTGDVITEITYCTFAGLDNIESVTIGNSVATIGNGAFYGCTNLSSVVLGDSVDTIGELAFYNCGIDSLVIPNSVTVIGYGALLGCNSIESLTIPFVGGSLATSSSTGYLGYIFGDISYRKETFKVLSDTNVPTSLTTLTITCGAIADNALQYMTSITTVVIGDDVTSIGNYAFSGCSKLASVTIGSGVSKIGYCAFSACSNLTTVTIGSSVSSIGVDAFYSCSSMADVYYNGAVVDWCNISFGRYASNPMYYADNFYISDGSDNFGVVTEIVIPDSISTIGNYQFCGFGCVTNITIGDHVTSIGNYALYNCTALTSIIISDNVTSIGSYAFQYCTALDQVYYDADITNTYTAATAPFSYSGSSVSGCTLQIGDNVQSIASYMFYDFDYVTSITISDSVTSIGSYAFQYCTALNQVYYDADISNTYTAATAPFRYSGSSVSGCTLQIGDNVQCIASYMFYDFDFVTSITISDSVTSIGNYAFQYCTALNQVYYDADIANTYTAATAPFRYSGSSVSGCQLQIGDNVQSISSYMFYDFDYVTSVVISDSVTIIDSYAFSSCSSLVNMHYDGTVGDWCVISFDNAYSNPMHYADNIYMLDDSNEYYLVAELVIPDSVTSINSYAFYNCSVLASIIIPDSIIDIGSYAFYNCYRLVEIYNLSDLEVIADSDDYGYVGYYALDIYSDLNTDSKLATDSNGFITRTNNDSVTLIGYIGTDTNITIPDTITEIYNFAFYRCIALTSVTIGSSVTNIDNYAFYNCTGLTTVTIDSSVSKIATYAFNGCSSIVDVYYNGTVTDWCSIRFGNAYSNPMYYADNLYMLDDSSEYYLVTELVIPDSVASISSYAFYNCAGLTTVTIDSSVTSIGSSAFNGCSSIVDVYYNGTVADWCSISFTNAYSNPMYYADNLYMLDGSSEYYLVTELVIPDSVTSIGSYAFYNCTGLTTVVIDSSVTSIGSYAFYGCSSIVDVYYNGTVADWCSISFGNAYSNPMYYADNLYMLDDSSEYYLVTELVIPDSVTSIGSYAFYNCTGLTTVTIGSDVVRIGSDTFYGCSSIVDVYYNGTVADWCSISFGNAYSNPMYYADNLYMLDDSSEYYLVAELVIPDSVASISSYAFYNCTGLTTVTIDSSVIKIATYAFYGCSSLDSVELLDSDNWYCSVNNEAIDVTDTEQNATWFSSTYPKYYWYKVSN